MSAAAAGFGYGGLVKGVRPTRGYAEDYIVLRGFAAGHFLAAGFGVIFADLGGGGSELLRLRR